MNTLRAVIVGLIVAFTAQISMAGGHGGGFGRGSSRIGGSHSGFHFGHRYSAGTYSFGIARDANGRIHRSMAAKREFMRQTGYPNGRPGYVVDHIIPLKRGGADSPSNMQWQTKEEAKAKDKTE